MVNSENYPVKEGTVQWFSHGVPHSHSLKGKKKKELETIHALHWNVLHLLSSHVQWLYFALAKASACCSTLHPPATRGSQQSPRCSARPGHELCPWTLAWLTVMHSSGWRMRSSNKSHDQKQKEKIYMDFNFTEIAVEFTSPSKGKARGGWILRGNQQVDGEACAEASSTSEIFCCVYPQRISFAQGATHRIRKERFILQGYLCTWLFGFLPWIASAHTDNPKSLQYQQQPSSYTWVGFIRKNKAADCVFIQNYFNKALDTHQWLCIHHSQNLLTNIPTNIHELRGPMAPTCRVKSRSIIYLSPKAPSFPLNILGRHLWTRLHARS